MGIAKVFPLSRTPRRLTAVNTTTRPTEIATVCGAAAGIAEVIAATPATTDTATVIT